MNAPPPAGLWGISRLELVLLAAVFLFGVAFRLVLVVRTDPLLAAREFDAAEYVGFAKSLSAGRFDDYPRTLPNTRAPGYSLFLIPFLQGDLTMGVRVVQSLQAVLGASLALLIGALARHYAGPIAGVLAAAWLALHPMYAFWCPQVMSETVFMAFLWLGLALLLWPKGKPPVSLWPTMLAGICIGYATLVRPGLQAFLPPCALWVGWCAWRDIGWRRGLLQSSVFTASVSLLLLPWMIVFFMRTGEFSVSPGFGKTNFGMGNHPELLRVYEAPTAEEFQRRLTGHLGNFVTTSGVSQEQLVAEAREFIRTDPVGYLRLFWHKTVNFWRPWLYPLIFPRSWVAVSALFGVPVFVGGLVGLATGALPKRVTVLVIALCLAGWVQGGLLFLASVRYRIPYVDPALAILASCYAGQWFGRFRAKRTVLQEHDEAEAPPLSRR